MASNLTPLAPIEQHSDNVIRILGMNPGPFTLQGTNTYLIGTGRSRLLIDSGEGLPEYTQMVLDTMLNHEVDHIEAILLTHYHHDHVGGVQPLLRALAKKFPNSSPPRILKQKCASEDNGLDFEFENIENGQLISVEGATLQAIYTPGHSCDHTCFLIKEDQAIFCGDTILGAGSCVFQNLKTYMESLRLLLEFQPQSMYPGHGPMIADGMTYIKGYISHRETREKQILAALSDNPDQSMSSLQIVYAVYKNVAYILLGVIQLAANLVHAAQGNVQLHLGKLWQEGLVQAVGSADSV